ncbi:hypothetical protein Sru01_22630 [Sphaerisporangium rufum]|uniref:Uncharacterized protein n=1 Tax=Sphaerisporangium rufum TaxID=1381558 RepID=A0A919R2M8_9ACTN|nr:hypothetical protein Sru01_22630 [Sphaerisporangium rufum]
MVITGVIDGHLSTLAPPTRTPERTGPDPRRGTRAGRAAAGTRPAAGPARPAAGRTDPPGAGARVGACVGAGAGAEAPW